ncbi:MAG: hypothetical protein AAF731_21895 [Bacteroidota bacterium]
MKDYELGEVGNSITAILKYNGRILNPDKNNYYRDLQVLITFVNDHKDGFKKIRNKELMEKGRT